MQVWRSLDDVPAPPPRPGPARGTGGGGAVVTFGTFDGVHRGHASVLAAVVGAARGRGLTSAAVTFDPHPLAVLRPDVAPVPLVTAARRLELLAEAGLDAVLQLRFTPELAALDARWFVEEVLVGALGAALVVVGDDARFGKAHEGDLAMLRRLGDDLGVEVVGIGRGDAPPTWSSSWVRRAVAAGDVAGAAEVLGRPHRVEGVVVHGDHRGRELGYPTANLGDIAVAVPADGVYAAWMRRLDPPAGTPTEDVELPAAVSIGTNPTFDGVRRQVEAHALGRTDLDLYTEHVALDVVERLRPTLRFDSVAELLDQMALDTARCAVVLRAGNLGTAVTPAAEPESPGGPAPERRATTTTEEP